jgi:hypothetical protein
MPPSPPPPFCRAAPVHLRFKGSSRVRTDSKTWGVATQLTCSELWPNCTGGSPYIPQ